MPQSPLPSDWPRLSVALTYRDPVAAIDWLCRALGFEVRLKIEGDAGAIVHSELVLGEALIMVGGEGAPDASPPWRRTFHSPRSTYGAITASMMLYVDDVDAHGERARGCGATIIDEPSLHDYGAEYWVDRSYGLLDCEGQMWWISQRLSGSAQR